MATRIAEAQLSEESKPILNAREFVDLAREQGANILLLETKRNTGKTTQFLQVVFDEITKHAHKCVWIREQKQQAEAISRNFMDRYGEMGFKLQEKTGALYDPAGKTVAHFLSVNGRISRSGDVFNDQRLGIKTDMIIYDEYNELESIDSKLFIKVTQLIESIQRDNPDAMLVLVGNRDKPNNPFLHKLGLKPETNFTETKIQKVVGQYGTALICRIGDEYRVFRPKQSISAFLAEFDSDLTRYIHNGGYLEEGLENVLTFRNWIQPSFRPLVKLVVNGVKYTLGEFAHYDKGQQMALCRNYPRDDVDSLALDSWSDILTPNAGRASDKSTELFSKLIFDSYKERVLYFDEFETLEEFARLFTGL